jgi:hypothetical protein
MNLDTTMPNPAILPLWSLSTCPLVLPHPTIHNHAGFSPRTALHHPHATPCRPYDHHNAKPYPGPLLSTTPCHIALTLHAKHTRHRPRSKGTRHARERIVITTTGHARACTSSTLDAPGRHCAQSPSSSSPFSSRACAITTTPVPSWTRLLARGSTDAHAMINICRRGTARTPPSPARHRPSFGLRSSALAPPSSRLHAAHHSLPLRSLERPRRRRPPRHPCSTRAPINRATPSTISSHSLILLPSLLPPDHPIGHHLAGVARI